MSDPLLPAEGHKPEPPANEPRLESWGEIASYLRRDVRTVQRWERTLGLPVRRLRVGKLSSVYAYRTELDKWYLERQPPDLPELDKIEPTVARDLAPNDGGEEQPRHFPFISVVVGMVVILAVAAGLYYPRHRPGSDAKVRLFVRPFANRSGESQQSEFIGGLTDEIIAQLGRIDPAHLGVIAPTSSELLAKKPIDELGRLLQVQYILEGSVRRGGNQVSIDVELIQVSDQTHLWADSYKGNLSDIAGVQDQVAAAVAKQIHVAIPAPTGTANKVDPEAYDAYLKGRNFWASRELSKSIAAYLKALEKDGNYAPAYAGLASAYLLVGNVPNDGMRPSEATPKAREAAQHAIQLNPTIAEAHCVLANIAMSYDRDFATAEREYQMAISYDPNYATAHEWFAHYLIVRNRLPEARTEMSHALNLDPFSPLLNSATAEMLYYARDYDASIGQAQSTLEAHPDFMLARFWLASDYREKKMYPEAIAEFGRVRQQSGDNSAMLMAYGHALAISGDSNGAHKVLAELEKRSRSRYVPALYFAAIYTGLGDKNAALSWLEKAYDERNDRVIYDAVEPMADPLRSEPRFQALLHRVGLP
jgi:TolB-like protein/Tfp pilus assembly protein PilF